MQFVSEERDVMLCMCGDDKPWRPLRKWKKRVNEESKWKWMPEARPAEAAVTWYPEMSSRNPLRQWHQSGTEGTEDKYALKVKATQVNYLPTDSKGCLIHIFEVVFCFFPLEKEDKLKEVIKLSFLRARARPNLFFQHKHPNCIMQRWHEMNN